MTNSSHEEKNFKKIIKYLICNFENNSFDYGIPIQQLR